MTYSYGAIFSLFRGSLRFGTFMVMQNGLESWFALFFPCGIEVSLIFASERSFLVQFGTF